MNTAKPLSWSCAAIILTCAITAQAESEAYKKLWSDPQVEQRIADGIAKHRMSDVKLRVVDAQGNPVNAAEIQVTQVSHDFLFGANIFMLGCFESPEMNAAYEKAFVGLLNAATVPFYWKAYETKPGEYRFGDNASLMRRRPVPDKAIAFCKASGITPHGHTLVWDNPKWAIPEWLPADVEMRKQIIQKWVTTVCERYGDRIGKWDVLNEPMLRKKNVPMPENYEVDAFLTAARAMPTGVRLFINEATQVWSASSNDTYRNLIKDYKARGAIIDAAGMQFHMFNVADFKSVMEGKKYPPSQLFAALDKMIELKLPLHISEITIPSGQNKPEELADQALATRNFYRLWFSHQAVEAITWWNLADGTAAKGEDHLNSGMLDKDLKPKPAYETLRKLIHEDWTTRTTLKAAPEATFRGFHGKYRYTAKAGERTISGEFHVDRLGKNEFEIKLSAGAK